MTTYKCIGTCRRTGMTEKELGQFLCKSQCPYCLGIVINEVTENTFKSPLPNPAHISAPSALLYK